jgi:hypothetical protein
VTETPAFLATSDMATRERGALPGMGEC